MNIKHGPDGWCWHQGMLISSVININFTYNNTVQFNCDLQINDNDMVPVGIAKYHEV